ncbi:MAG: sulfurtransferase-like selenium metabolism protein YedF [Planctomycetes bacterium]|nr:sulfurtransferase-like selenium metabolism protein YedF [Planctomycetota bacterium]
MIQLYMRGKPCPLPVIEAKKRLADLAAGDELEVVVDNDAARENLRKLAEGRNCDFRAEATADGDISVVLSARADAAGCAVQADDAVVVAIGTDRMGTGDDDLGRTLLKSFIFSLTELDTPPAVVVFYNGGVHLACDGSAALKDLRTLTEKGTAIMACGACLNHFGKTEALRVGTVTNMFAIVETLSGAARTVHLT